MSDHIFAHYHKQVAGTELVTYLLLKGNSWLLKLDEWT